MERLKRIQGAIFDLDGTLLDSMGIWEEIDRRFLERRNIPLPEDYVDKINAMEFPQAAAYTVQRFGLKETPKELMEEWNQLSRTAYAQEIQLKPMAKEYLESLARRGVQLGVATSSTRDLFVPALRRNGVLSLFSSFTTTAEVSRGKGFPDVYWRAAEKLGLPPADCAVFEDVLPGIQGANQGGFLSVGVYDPSSQQEKCQIRREAQIFIHSYAQLL